MKLITEDDIQMNDYSFFKLCELSYGINRGVYNTIDTVLYKKGIKNILTRRKTIVSFLEFAIGKSIDLKCNRYKFGHGGLTLKLSEFCLTNHIT